ncbi:MAG: phosphoribosylformylglycinamidine cyclo-ligase [Bdellovibrionia bacterium]
MAAWNYADSGVNRRAADQLVETIARLSKKTLNSKVKSAVGGYASLYALDSKRCIAASTDGVGTKLKLAFRLKDHRSVGLDLVAMSVNDLLCVGAEPLFFLDYFASGKLLPGVAQDVISGIVEGCQQAGCALVGGETAEMPDFYSKGEYDLAGFAVGLVQNNSILPKKTIRPQDVLIGLASSGCHSNGYSLLRKWIPKGQSGDALAKTLLKPTRIYAQALLPLIRKNKIKGLAHITGSGFLNVPRMSESVSYSIRLPGPEKWPPIYDWILERSKLPWEELAQTFNLGVGMVAVVDPAHAQSVIGSLKRSGEEAWVLGEVIKKSPSQRSRVLLYPPGPCPGDPRASSDHAVVLS